MPARSLMSTLTRPFVVTGNHAIAASPPQALVKFLRKVLRLRKQEPLHTELIHLRASHHLTDAAYTEVKQAQG